jgi:hypothetical protein
MPKTILKLTQADKEKLSILERPFWEIPCFHEVLRSMQSKRIGPKEGPRIRDNLIQAMQKKHDEETFLTIDALKTFDDGWISLHHYAIGFFGSLTKETEWAWELEYYPRFGAWIKANGFEGWEEFSKWPPQLAGVYHLRRYGNSELTSLNFDDTPARAMLYETLHENSLGTLGQLAALSPVELYELMKKSPFSHHDKQWSDVRDFLKKHYLKIHTVLEE